MQVDYILPEDAEGRLFAGVAWMESGISRQKDSGWTGRRFEIERGDYLKIFWEIGWKVLPAKGFGLGSFQSKK